MHMTIIPTAMDSKLLVALDTISSNCTFLEEYLKLYVTFHKSVRMVIVRLLPARESDDSLRNKFNS